MSKQIATAKLSTEELARAFKVKPQSVRASLCRQGHFLGLRPVKLANGRLLWDEGKSEQILGGEVA